MSGLVALLFAPLKIDIEYRNSKLKIIVKCLFVKVTLDKENFAKNKSGKTRKDKPKAENTEKVGVIEKLKNLKKSFDEVKFILNDVFEHMRDKIEFSGIYVRIKYGTGDAAITGMIYGAIWSFIGNIYSFFCRFFRIKFPKVELEPQFGGKEFEIEVEGIITTRLVHIIIAAIRSGKNILKRKKERIKDGRTASNSRSYVHSNAEHKRYD